MQFVVFVARGLVRAAPVLIKATAKGAARAAPVIIKPAVNFTRGAVTGAPRYVPIAGKTGVKVADVTPFVTAGIQTRQVAIYVVKAATIRGPLKAVNVAKYALRSAVRDAKLPYDLGVHAYGAIRYARIARGATSLAERKADTVIFMVGRNLNRIGLEPRLTGTVASLARVALYGTAIKGLEYAGEHLAALERYRLATVDTYKSLEAKYLPATPVVRVDSVPETHQPVAPPVVVAAPPRTAAPALAPAPATSPRGAPIIYTPPPRNRR